MPLIELRPDDAENAQGVDGNTGDNYIRVEMSFNSLVTEFFEGSDISQLIQRMLGHIKAKVENLSMPESDFALDKIIHLYINFPRLALTRSGSYIKLPKWIKSKKAVINPQDKVEECFEQAFIVALHHEEIKRDHQRTSKLRSYENQYNWEGLEFPVLIKKIDKFEKNNPGMAVNVLFNNKKNQKKEIYIQSAGQGVTGSVKSRLTYL